MGNKPGSLIDLTDENLTHFKTIDSEGSLQVKLRDDNDSIVILTPKGSQLHNFAARIDNSQGIEIQHSDQLYHLAPSKFKKHIMESVYLSSRSDSQTSFVLDSRTRKGDFRYVPISELVDELPSVSQKKKQQQQQQNIKKSDHKTSETSEPDEEGEEKECVTKDLEFTDKEKQKKQEEEEEGVIEGQKENEEGCSSSFIDSSLSFESIKEDLSFINVEKIPIISEEQRQNLEYLDRAKFEHAVVRHISSRSVGVMRPYKKEYYPRIYKNSDHFPYVMLSTRAYMIFKLWQGSGVSQAYLIRSLIDFINSKNELRSQWNINILESYLVCNMYSIYEDINPDTQNTTNLLNTFKDIVYTVGKITSKNSSVSHNDLSDSEKERKVQREAQLELIKMVVGDEFHCFNDLSTKQNWKDVSIQQRLWCYYQSKETILQKLFPNVTMKFEPPLNIKNKIEKREEKKKKDNNNNNNNHGPTEDFKTTHNGRYPYRSYNPVDISFEKNNEYKRKKGKEGSTKNKQNYDDDITKEQYIMEKILKSILAASSQTSHYFDMYMECMRHIQVEIRDLCHQVRVNKLMYEEVIIANEEKKYKQRLRKNCSNEYGSSIYLKSQGPTLQFKPEVQKKYEEMKDISYYINLRKLKQKTKRAMKNSGNVIRHKNSVEYKTDGDSNHDSEHESEESQYEIKIEETVAEPSYDPDLPHLPISMLEKFEKLLDNANKVLSYAMEFDSKQGTTEQGEGPFEKFIFKNLDNLEIYEDKEDKYHDKNNKK